MKTLLIIIIALVAGLGSSFAGPVKTMKNLQSAYQDEANAVHKYELYSNKAAQEGYDQVAKLFCAVSESEAIHMRNHRDAIEKLGGTPEKIKYEKVSVNSTKMNLKLPITEESRESNDMYPEYIHEAKKENAPVAEKSFKYAEKSEAEHKMLFKEALHDLGKNKNKDYYVSNVSGETFEVAAGAPAPKPHMKGEKFDKVE